MSKSANDDDAEPSFSRGHYTSSTPQKTRNYMNRSLSRLRPGVPSLTSDDESGDEGQTTAKRPPHLHARPPSASSSTLVDHDPANNDYLTPKVLPIGANRKPWSLKERLDEVQANIQLAPEKPSFSSSIASDLAKSEPSAAAAKVHDMFKRHIHQPSVSPPNPRQTIAKNENSIKHLLALEKQARERFTPSPPVPAVKPSTSKEVSNTRETAQRDAKLISKLTRRKSSDDMSWQYTSRPGMSPPVIPSPVISPQPPQRRAPRYIPEYQKREQERSISAELDQQQEERERLHEECLMRKRYPAAPQQPATTPHAPGFYRFDPDTPFPPTSANLFTFTPAPLDKGKQRATFAEEVASVPAHPPSPEPQPSFHYLPAKKKRRRSSGMLDASTASTGDESAISIATTQPPDPNDTIARIHKLLEDLQQQNEAKLKQEDIKPLVNSLQDRLAPSELENLTADLSNILADRKIGEDERHRLYDMLNQADKVDRSLSTRMDDIKRTLDDMGTKLTLKVKEVMDIGFESEAKRRTAWLLSALLFELFIFWIMFIFADARATHLAQTVYFDPFYPALYTHHGSLPLSRTPGSSSSIFALPLMGLQLLLNFLVVSTTSLTHWLLSFSGFQHGNYASPATATATLIATQMRVPT